MTTVNHSSHLIHKLAQTKNPEAIRQKLLTMADTIGIDHFRKQAAREIVAGTQPERAIPDVYQAYRPLVRDGIQFFLSHISLQRLVEVMVHQLLMERDSATEERLLELAKQFPTLHKLGQIIARNQNIEPSVKQWLIHLENGQYDTAPEELLAHINRRLAPLDGQQRVKIEPYILAEASVGAVIPFQWDVDGSKDAIQGVFKVLKPQIKAKLDEELAVFEKMAVYFDDNRQLYALKDFKFLDVFKDVSDILTKEVNLDAEQSHLSKAARFYRGTDQIVIPELIRFCDGTMTAMGHIDGPKITDADLTHVQRRQCAHILAESLICHPLFAASEPALFHGDPHAGNILLSPAAESDSVKIALLDWSLAGHLSQKVRAKIVALIKGILMDDFTQICNSLQSLVKRVPQKDAMPRSELRAMVITLMHSKVYASYSLLRKAFWLLEQLSYEGIVFPPDLMLFRKAIFTLEGVLFDLYPQFNMDTFVFRYMTGLLANELPQRFGNTLFLQADKPENYQSLLSNSDLQTLLMHQYMENFKRTWWPLIPAPLPQSH